MAATATAYAEDIRPIWLTLDEVADKMRFKNRRALLSYLRRHPAPVFQRIGSQRYFMRAEDVDRIMAPIDLPAMSRRRQASAGAEEDPAAFVQVEAPAPSAAPRPLGRPPGRAGRSGKATGHPRRVTP